MLAAISSLLLASALSVTPEFSVALKGADSVECDPVSADGADACFVGASSIPVYLHVLSSDGEPAIHAVSFGIFQSGKSTAVASGQLVDGRGQTVYLERLPLPQANSGDWGSDEKAVEQTPGRYVVQTQVGTGDNVLSRRLALDILPDQDASPVAWPLGNTGLAITPEGEWCDMRDRREMPGTLDIEMCAKPGARIVAFIVQPVAGVSLTQYVNNSIEAYSATGTWHVRKRELCHVGVAEGAHLSLDQKIAGVSVPIEKYFLAVDSKIVILSFYGVSPSEAGEWATSMKTGTSAVSH